MFKKKRRKAKEKRRKENLKEPSSKTFWLHFFPTWVIPHKQ